MLILGADELQIRPNGESALEMLMLGAVELQIRPNGAYKIKGVSDIHSQPGGNAKCYLKHAFECNRAEPAP